MCSKEHQVENRYNKVEADIEKEARNVRTN